MIQETTMHACHVCKSIHIVKNGTNRCGNAQYRCKVCDTCRVLKPKPAYSESDKQYSGLAWNVVVCVESSASLPSPDKRLLAGSACMPEIADTLLPVSPENVLELDEVWSFVLKKDGTRRIWIAMCRRTRHIAAVVIGNRRKATCHRLWKAIPNERKHCHTLSDF